MKGAQIKPDLHAQRRAQKAKQRAAAAKQETVVSQQQKKKQLVHEMYCTICQHFPELFGWMIAVKKPRLMSWPLT